VSHDSAEWADHYQIGYQMPLEIEHAEPDKTQRRYARLAGFSFLGEILIALGGGLILFRVAGNGTFSETAIRIAASERLYRLGLSVGVSATLSSALLAFSLYATLKPVNSLLAQLAMIFSLGDSFLWFGCAPSCGSICTFPLKRRGPGPRLRRHSRI
jgi:hypothetical protein